MNIIIQAIYRNLERDAPVLARFMTEEDVEWGIPAPTEFFPMCIGYFPMCLSEDGTLSVENTHKQLQLKNGEFGNGPLKLTVMDLGPYSQIIEHWKQIAPRFTGDIDISTTYTPPDGRIKKRDPKPLPEITEGKSIDDKFQPGKCIYIKGHPYEQHYKHDRLDYRLFRDSIAIEHNKTVQLLEGGQIETVRTILRYIAKDPSSALQRLIGEYC